MAVGYAGLLSGVVDLVVSALRADSSNQIVVLDTDASFIRGRVYFVLAADGDTALQFC